MRSPFTGIIFVLELTHDVNILLPLVLAVTIAHGFTVLTMKRSILTEKVSRRGYHLTREYAVDPLEVLFVREVMRTKVAVLAPSMSLKELRETFTGAPRSQRLFPITGEGGRLAGVVTQGDIGKYIEREALTHTEERLEDVVRPNPAKAYPDETLTMVVNRMAATGFTGFPVVDRSDPQKLLGLISLNDLLKARVRRLQEEQRRERLLPLRLMFPRGKRWQRAEPVSTERLAMKKEPQVKWGRVRNPDNWDGLHGGFDENNAKMVCRKCHQESPFDLKCRVCGSSKLVLGTAAGIPGIFCSVCHEGQWHWDCPNCACRQDFAASFFYKKNAAA